MLTTASYSFDKLVDMVGSVREVIPADMPLLVNTDDMQLDQCRQLKAAGAITEKPREVLERRERKLAEAEPKELLERRKERANKK